MTVPHQTSDQPPPPAEPDTGVPLGSRLDALLSEVRGVPVVDPAHPELLDAAAAVDEPKPTDAANTARPGASPVPSRGPARGAQCAPTAAPVKKTAEALGRGLRRVRQALRDADTAEAIRLVFERCNASTYPAGCLEAEVGRVAGERRNAAGAVSAARAAADEWERVARAALASVAAAPPPEIEDVEPEGGEPGEPLREPVCVKGVPVDRIEDVAGPIGWWVDRLALLTQGTWFDLTVPCDKVLFRGKGEAERRISGTPVERITELLATRKAAKLPAGEEVESPTWELAAYGVALFVALAPKGAGAFKKLGALAHRGSVSAARGLRRAVVGVKVKGPRR